MIDTRGDARRPKFWTNWMIGRHAADALLPGGSLTFTSGTGARAHDVSATYVANLGLRALVEGLAYEMAPERRVNAVAPTFMGSRTAFWRNMPATALEEQQAGFSQLVPLQRIADVDEIASAYVYFITNAFITGQTLLHHDSKTAEPSQAGRGRRAGTSLRTLRGLCPLDRATRSRKKTSICSGFLSLSRTRTASGSSLTRAP